MHESIARLILVLIVFLPLGSWGDSLLLTSIYAPLCMIAGALCLATQRKPHNYLPAALFLPPLLLLCLYLLLQLVPLPQELLKLISPTTSRAYQETIWVVQENARMPLAVNTEATLRALLFVAAVGSLCLATGQLLASHGHFGRIMQFFNLAIAAWAFSAIVITALLPLFHDHFPLWDEVIMLMRARLNLWAICLMPILLAGHSIHKPRGTRLPLISQFRAFLRDPAENPHIGEALAIFLVAVCTLASRNWQGAILLIFAWSVFKALTLSRHNPKKVMLRGLYSFISAACLGSFYVLRGGLLGGPWGSPPQLSSIAPYDSDWFFTWFGCGLGGHIDLLPSADPGICNVADGFSLGGAVDLWLGMGTWGMVLLVAIIFMLLRYAAKDSGNSKTNMRNKILVGGATSLFLLSLFGFYPPGLNWEALFCGFWAVLLIMLSPRLSQSVAGPAYSGKSFYPFISVCLCILVSTVLLFSLLFYAGLHAVERVGDHVTVLHSASLDDSQLKSLDDSVNATLAWFPFVGKSNLPLFQGYLDYYRMNEVQTVDAFERALVNRPLNPQILMALIGTYGWLNRTATAEQLMASGPLKNYRPEFFLERLITRLFNVEITETGLKVMRMTFELCPEYVLKCLNLLYVNGWSYDQIQDFLPAKTGAWVNFGDMLYTQGKIEKAEEVYIRAVAMRDPEMSISQEPYQRLTKHFLASGQLTRALIVAESGVERFPQSGTIRRVLAEVYARVGNREKAAQEYRQADILDRQAQ